jgi:hypothetical protein
MVEMAMNHPVIPVILGVVVAIVVIALSQLRGRGSPDSPKDSEVEEDDLTRVTILGVDGKVLESLVATSDSIDFSEGYVQFETKEGQRVMYLLGQLSAKLEDI